MIETSDRYFDPYMIEEELPPLALRYLAHAIRAGTSVAHQAEIIFRGQIRMKPRLPWMSFHARETITLGQGYCMDAHARLGLLPITTHDSYEAGAVSSRLSLFGLLPLKNRHGADAARSARGRLIAESTWLPTTFLPESGAHWSEERDHLHLSVPVDGQIVQVYMHVEADGRLRQFSLLRWNNLTNDRKYAWIPFATYIDAERTFGDYTVPSVLRSSWWAETDREFEFFRAKVDDVHYTVDKTGR
jgi:hypothetical protein